MPIVNSAIDDTTKIYHRELVNIYDTVIGANCIIGAFVEIGGAIIKSGCRIGSHAFICPGVVLENDVFIGPGVRFSNDKYPPTPKEEYKPIVTHVEKGASIGIGAVILPGCTIGAGALIGAGAIVTRSVVPNAIVRNNPARMVNARY
jgi:acetyltransferase-like isoleucine patch superfamily enzyme